METGNVIFQDMESFEKGWFVKMIMEKFWIFVWKNYTIC